MGYKVLESYPGQNRKCEYYLNHVGYKAMEQVQDDLFTDTYYLNHVGYKAQTLILVALFLIWFMYYLNHVGYKDSSLLRPLGRKYLQVLSEPCGI